ncbi:MAG TPA: acyl-CoA dehydrogenase family protein [Solirubrobacteraceae bacterium]|nr:acyl-CoA dehydrogenase family protein [Solirubrobacteraceae bacterium]
MDFDLNEDQREIKAVARELLSARSTWARVREVARTGEYDEELWREICGLGWPGIAVSEENGGQGLGIVELAVLLEELGYACAAVPFLSTAVAAAIIDRDRAGSLREHLPGLLRGETRVGIGRSQLIIDGAGGPAALLIDEGRLREVDSAREPLVTIDPTRRFGRLVDEPDAVTPSADTGGQAAALLTTALAAELVGVCQRALDMTLAYVKERRQFGVPVGSFQAVSHRCAEMLFHTESARSGAYYAAWAADAGEEGSVSLPEAAAIAGAAAATAGREVTASAIQAHGGIGFTWEADVHWLYKRAEVDRALLGGTASHHAALARAAAGRLAASA